MSQDSGEPEPPPAGDENPPPAGEENPPPGPVDENVAGQQQEPPVPKPRTKDVSPNDCQDDTPTGVTITQQEIDDIIAYMLNILQECQKKIDEQKVDSHSLVFMLMRIKESLDAYYNDYFTKINAFLIHAERITAEYYAHLACVLPKYGDYLRAFEVETTENEGPGAEARKQDLINLVKTVTDNYYACGMFIKSGRMVLKDVNNCQPARCEIVNKMVKPLPKWMEFQDRVNNQLEQIRDQTFKITAHMDFLKQGEMKLAPRLDLTPLHTPPDQSKGSKETGKDRRPGTK